MYLVHCYVRKRVIMTQTSIYIGWVGVLESTQYAGFAWNHKIRNLMLLSFFNTISSIALSPCAWNS